MGILAEKDLDGDPVHGGERCAYGNDGDTGQDKAEINEYKVANCRKEYGCGMFLTEKRCHF